MSEFVQTIPASWYHDSKVFDLERKEIFGREWLYIAERHDLAHSGDYISLEIAGYPIFLMMGKDGQIRGFHNFCRHRAAPILTESKGNLKSPTLSCRYHGWTYELTGKLIQAPMMDHSKVDRSCDLDLAAIRVEEFNGMLFVNLDPKASALSEAFSAIQSEVTQAGYSMNEYTSYSSMMKEGHFNWKVWVDGYQECYHCTTIHPIFNKDFSLKKYQIQNKDRYSLHSCERKADSQLGGFNGLWLWIYPNLGMPCYEPCFYTLQVNPISPTRTRLNYRFRFKSSVSESERKEFLDTVEKITMEDVTICELVQKNLSAGVYQQGFLNPDRENGVEYFQSLVRRSVALG